MKFKKFTAFAAGLLITASLASCGGGGGEQEAIENAKKGILVMSSITSNPINPDTLVQLSADDNEAFICYTKTTKKDSQGNKYSIDVTYTWDDQFKDVIKLVDYGVENQKNLEFVYPDIGQSAVEIAFTANLKCGSATGTANFKAQLNPSSITYDDMTLEEFYKVDEDTGTFWFVDDDGEIVPNHGQSYLWVSLSGKITYIAPDQNWGILADGDKYVELYRIDEASDRNKIKVGDYIKVYGEVGKYCGNVQISWIKKMEVLEDHSKIKEPVEIDNIPEGINTKTSSDFKSFCSGVNNRVGTLQGTMVKKVTPSFSARFTFIVNIGSTPITVAYDYHTAKDVTEMINAYQAFFDAANAGTSITVRGTLRWASGAGEDGPINGNGVWQITPFLATDLQVK